MFPQLKKLPYEVRFEELGLWLLKERRNRADIIEVFKMVKHYCHLFHGIDSSKGLRILLHVDTLGNW